jgi:hypothetical protein
MADWLAGHPSIYMSPIKEPNFFNTDDRQLVATLDAYEELFREAREDHVAIGEASVWYLSSSDAVQNILGYNPEARFIVQLRNPIEMAPALHSEMVLSGHESVRDFRAAWDLQEERRQGRRLPTLSWAKRRLDYGKACALGAQVERLLSLVSKKRVLFVLLDDIVEDPRTEYLRVLQFLGVGDDGRTEFAVSNRARTVRWPRLPRSLFIIVQLKRRLRINLKLGLWRKVAVANEFESPRPPPSPETKSILRTYFWSDVEHLSELLNRDLGHWLQ